MGSVVTTIIPSIICTAVDSLFRWVKQKLYQLVLFVVGFLFFVLDEVSDSFSHWWFGTSVVNALGSGPVFELDKLGLNLQRAFSEETVKGSDPSRVTERDVVCGVLCKLAYEEDSKRMSVFKQWQKAGYLGRTDVKYLYKEFSYSSQKISYRSFHGKGVFRTNAFVLNVTPDSVVICFRGTQPFDLIQWFTDISFRQRSISYAIVPDELKQKNDKTTDIWIHRGFLAALGLDLKRSQRQPPKDNMVSQLVSHVSHLMQNGVKHVYIAGHSLGAALAQQFAFALKCSVPEQIRKWHVEAPKVGAAIRGVYTYGTPRSGDWKFARLFNEKFSRDKVIFHRVVNNDDVVGRVPFTGIRLQRIGKEAVDFQYGSTDGLIYLRLPTSNDELPEQDAEDVISEKEEDIDNMADEDEKDPEARVVVAPASEIEYRPDDKLGFIIGASSVLDHFPSSYCDRLATVWEREKKKKALQPSNGNRQLTGKFHGKVNGLVDQVSTVSYPKYRKDAAQSLVPVGDALRLLGAFFDTHQ